MVLRIFPSPSRVNHDSGAVDIRAAICRRIWLRNDRSIKCVTPNATKYKVNRVMYALTRSMTIQFTRAGSIWSCISSLPSSTRATYGAIANTPERKAKTCATNSLPFTGCDS